jgi:hypothetical protein
MEAPPPKRRFQFKLRTLLLVIVAASLASAAMKFATSGWAIATVSFTVLLLLFSVVLAAYRRPFWVGFAICGIGYLMLTVMPFMSELRSFLITSELVWFLQQKIHPEAGAYSNIPEHLRLIGDCLWTLILATLGGLLAQFAAGSLNGAAKAPDRS